MLGARIWGCAWGMKLPGLNRGGTKLLGVELRGAKVLGRVKWRLLVAWRKGSDHCVLLGLSLGLRLGSRLLGLNRAKLPGLSMWREGVGRGAKLLRAELGGA